MKWLNCFLLFLFPVLLWTQTINSTAIPQVDSLIKISREFTKKRDFEKALEINATAEQLARLNTGMESAAYGSCCFNHGRILFQKGDHKGAEPWYLRSKSIREKVLGKEHPDYAWSLNNLGLLYTRTGQFDKAEEALQASKDIRGRILGKEHNDYLGSLANLAIVYLYTSEFSKAESLFIEAKNIREKLGATESPEYAGDLINLGILYSNQRLYEKSEEYYLKAKTLFEVKLKNTTDPFYINCLNNLGIVYKDLGQFEKAEQLGLKSKEIWEQTLGKDHPNYAASLINLASLYGELGQFKKAVSLDLEALEIRKKILGTDHTDFAKTLNNLATQYYNNFEFDKAQSYFEQAKQIFEKSFGTHHELYATCLFNLGNTQFAMNNLSKANLLFLQAQTIYDSLFGKQNLDYALCQHKLGELQLVQGNYKDAEILLLNAKSIREKILGTQHLDYINSLSQLAKLYQLNHETGKAELLYSQISTLNRNQILSGLHHLSEREMNQYLVSFETKHASLLEFSEANPQYTQLINLCFDNALFYKGFLLNAYNQCKHLALSNPANSDRYQLLKSFCRRLAAEYVKPLEERENVAGLEEQYNILEKEIVHNVSGMGQLIQQINWKDVQQKLKPDEAAIEFQYYKIQNIDSSESIRYVALLLRADHDQVLFIPICNQAALDSLLRNNADRKSDYVNALYSIADRGAVATELPKRSLYELIWKPLESHLKGIKRIYYSPSGLLHRINMSAIPVSSMEALADRYLLIELNSTRQLVIPGSTKSANHQVVLFGGIQYDPDSSTTTIETGIASRSAEEVSFTSTNQSLRGGNWNYLEGTAREVNSIAKLLSSSAWQPLVKKGNEATEEFFKSTGIDGQKSPYVLHVATHGYFFPDMKEVGSSQLADGNKEPVFKMSDHPMLRSGLIMSDGNYAWKNGKPLTPDTEDGILTAYEISHLNLSNTELVILSACETGLGDIQGNEGVYGLQRAFKIAGVKYIIMSLWQVPDKQTSLLMTTFYKKWLENNLPIPDAFHAAQKELREAGLDPYQWAGFVLIE